MTTSPEVLNVANNRKQRRHYDRLRASFLHRGMIAFHLSPQIEDALSLVAGVDLVEQELRGSEVILRFKRNPETLAATAQASGREECPFCIEENGGPTVAEQLGVDAITLQWECQRKHREHTKEDPTN